MSAEDVTRRYIRQQSPAYRARAFGGVPCSHTGSAIQLSTRRTEKDTPSLNKFSIPALRVPGIRGERQRIGQKPSKGFGKEKATKHSPHG